MLLCLLLLLLLVHLLLVTIWLLLLIVCLLMWVKYTTGMPDAIGRLDDILLEILKHRIKYGREGGFDVTWFKQKYNFI